MSVKPAITDTSAWCYGYDKLNRLTGARTGTPDSTDHGCTGPPRPAKRSGRKQSGCAAAGDRQETESSSGSSNVWYPGDPLTEDDKPAHMAKRMATLVAI